MGERERGLSGELRGVERGSEREREEGSERERVVIHRDEKKLSLAFHAVAVMSGLA